MRVSSTPRACHGSISPFKKITREPLHSLNMKNAGKWYERKLLFFDVHGGGASTASCSTAVALYSSQKQARKIWTTARTRAGDQKEKAFATAIATLCRHRAADTAFPFTAMYQYTHLGRSPP